MNKNKLDAEIIQKLIPDGFSGEIYCADCLESSNQTLWEMALESAPDHRILLCEEQKAGRGRMGRSWHSPSGKNLYCSILLRNIKNSEVLPRLAMFFALSLCRTIREWGLDARIKWPNDIWIRDKKLAGILMEVHSQKNHPEFVVVGMGVNLNIEAFPEEIQDIASSVLIETGQEVDRNLFCAKLLESLRDIYKKCETEESFEPYYQEYRTYLLALKQKICLKNGTKAIDGIFIDVDSRGFLKLEKANGEKLLFASGDVQMRPADEKCERINGFN